MGQFSRYQIFCDVIALGSFTKVAQMLGYSQSAVSQAVKSLENELEVTLVERKKDGIVLTKDGEEYFPYVQAIRVAEDALIRKKNEFTGLYNSTISIGAFTSVSRALLPHCMTEFKSKYPTINFIIKQGDYNQIINWVQNGEVDFGFIGMEVPSSLQGKSLYRDELMAILPSNHPLSQYSSVHLSQLSEETFILLEEGVYSTTLKAFFDVGINLEPAYTLYDDYSILSMIRQGLGVSMMYPSVLEGYESQIDVRTIIEHPARNVSLIWKDWHLMSFASKKFAKNIIKRFRSSGRT